MATFPEARAKKTERQRREQRLYTPDRRGPLCGRCREWTVDVLGYHPTCLYKDDMKPPQRPLRELVQEAKEGQG